MFVPQKSQKIQIRIFEKANFIKNYGKLKYILQCQ